MKQTRFLLVIGFVINLLSYSQTHIPAGNVSGNWTAAESPYIIDGKITINQDDQLTIEAGVIVEFSDNFMFKIKGRLLAIGTEMDSIHFTAQDTAIGWHGLRFIETDLNSLDSSIIKYCTFRYGKAIDEGKAHWWYDRLGGAIYARYSSKLSVMHSTFEFNNASYSGAIYLGHSNIRMNYLTIRNNRTYHRGGAIYVDTSNLILSNSLIYNNYSGDFGGSICYITDEISTNFELKNVEIHHNIAGTGGGGISIHGNSPDIIFQNVDIHHNTAPHGGGISGPFNVISCNEVNIHHNEAVWVGGGIYIYQSSDGDIISNMNIYDNICEGGGGGIFIILSENLIADHLLIYNNTADRAGGIIVDSSLNCEFRNVTIANNKSDLGEGGLSVYNHSSITITACIIAENEQKEIYISHNSEATAPYSLIMGGYPGLEVSGMDPLFTDPATDDYSLSWQDFPDHNETKSPCIDGGDPIYIDPDGTISDMGVIPYDQTYTPLTYGDISGTLTCAGSPYYIYGDQTIPVGQELIIEPCVFVIFQGPYKLKVDGCLLAEGTTSDNISFYAADTIEGWKGIQFYNQDSNGQDSSILNNCRILYGYTGMYGNGGGINLSASSEVRIENCLIANNRTDNNGGGIYGYNSHPLLKNNTLINNSAKEGGGIYGYSCKFIINGGTIENNTAESGGGLYFLGNDPELDGVTIRNNIASKFGGGILFNGNVNAVFGSSNRCSIYDNYAYMAGTDICGKDLYASVLIDLLIDTLTVLNPDDHFIYPISSFTKNITTGKNPQYASDLFVSPTGNDLNTGTTVSDPLKTISRALLTIEPNLTDTFNIHLTGGIYSNSNTGEKFPLNIRSGIALAGNEAETIILDGEDTINFFYFYDDNHCVISNLEMQNGFAEYGGAMHLEYFSTPLLQYIKIKDCESTMDGGGLFINEESSPLIYSANFSQNSGRYGGAICCNTSNASLYNVGFTNNIGYEGGAICTSHGDRVEIELGYFENNKANNGGACEFYRTDTVKINGTIFEKNEATAQYGGAMYIQEADVQINNSKLNGNRAGWCGGAISFYHSVNLALSNVRITNDTAAYGGGIHGSLWSSMALKNVVMHGNYAEGNSSYYGEGGAMYLSGIETDIINSTITNNEALDNGGAFYNKTGNINFINSILWSNAPNEIFLESGSATAEYSNIEGGYTGTGNLDINPEFYDPTDNDFSLQDVSQCINAGTPDTTGLSLPDRCLAGNPRIGNGIIDMGAYEFFARIDLELSVLLEGPFNGINMNADLTNNPELVEEFPYSQPYGISPWHYLGDESLTTAPEPDVVDWILIELRDATNAATATSDKIINSFAGLLLNDGSVVSKDGTSMLQFYDIASEQLFVTVKHRNHLGIISASPLTESGETYSYDFTTPLGQAYGTDAQKDLGGGMYGIFGGDGNADRTINIEDKTTIWSMEAGTTGYLNGDMNLNGQVDNNDKNLFLIPNLNESCQIPE